jgi:hypothetical protein
MTRATRPLLALGLALALGAGGLALLACARGTSRAAAPRPAAATGPRLDHPGHMDRGLECADCHMKDAKPGEEKEPKAPTYAAACQECHDEEDAKLPEEKKVKNLFFDAAGRPKWARALAPYDPEIRFRHAPHAKTACAACHGEMKGTDRRQGLVLCMDQCVACHVQACAPNECETCHCEIRKDVEPASHRHLWKERHGQAARWDAERTDGRCTLCHTEPAWCERCHREEPPRSHTNLFRTRTHGVLAAIDRSSCQVCHTTDYCQRCHMETPPRSHRGLWVGSVSTHCVNCHFPIRLEESCRVCHREEPRHESAPDMPAWHTAALNCRSCHTPAGAGGAPPLRHLDNGMQCTFCHH